MAVIFEFELDTIKMKGRLEKGLGDSYHKNFNQLSKGSSVNITYYPECNYFIIKGVKEINDHAFYTIMILIVMLFLAPFFCMIHLTFLTS
ncbi:MAG: hypothetical protein JJT94_11345 [Bernardetiaceae bacterium]|nr:hypothetical protein [Bernardetiaceae bacterium]